MGSTPTPGTPLADLRIRLQPKASRDEIVGPHGDSIRIRVTAPPVDGRANRALCRLIAKHAGVPPSAVSVIKGETSRDKIVRVEGLDEHALPEMLQLY